MKLYERIENNNFDEIDRNRAIELIEGGNGYLVYNENYFKLQKENEELKGTLRDTQNSWFEDTKKMEKLKRDFNKANNIAIKNMTEYVSKKEIKDQIEHYQELQNNYIEKYDEISENIQSMINVLQVLLEEGGNK